ncbi:MAG: hypothetical protein QM674_11405 [Burkholderiaceae bacterium]
MSEPDRVVILHDFERRCAAVDPDDHHLYAGLGCAAENLLQGRLRPALARFPGIGNRRPDLVIRIGRGARMPGSPRRPVANVIA